ncbi:hypothetical protein INT43_007355 [Umbelopsis isabellina]|uniref:Small ribosomal subunit protein mS38 n=1 Tax=Mortierella isabellina TaxID=91625 RepID=A0A8H7PYW2_MORIS|nr:hypothetical protein INT43_007355 [Umbelopsis isabellina]
MLSSAIRLSRPLSQRVTTRSTSRITSTLIFRSYSSEHNDGSNPNSNNPEELKRQTSAPRLPFVPVINIPEQELAHTAFFALHRPLLGLANEDKPYFGHQPYGQQDDSEDVEDLSQFMANMRPFAAPEQAADEDETTFTITLNPSHPPQTNDIPPTPMHNLETHVMPGADQIVDYLELLQRKMKKEDEAMEATSVLRKRKLKMNKHKHKKLRKRTRALRKRIGK